MKVLVITGSTRGIGYGLADSFLAMDCSVTVSGRSQASVDQAIARLSAKHGPDRILGQPCDVTQFDQVQVLWDTARAHFGQVDIWINNAGLANPQADFWKQEPDLMASVVETNLVGTMYGVAVALRGMLEQGWGSLYNMEGLGSDGRRVEGLTLYGSTKRSVRYLTDALIKEVEGTPVQVGALSPGMVVTELLTQQYEDRPQDWERAKRVFNILAERVETVTPWLAEQVLANDRNGVRIARLNRWKILGRFLMAPFRKRDLFS